VRQSSAHQVLHNRASSALQYALRDRLTALGWSQIEVIDDDLGRSAADGVQRAGFERMIAEVCLGKVGAVCARGLALRPQQEGLAVAGLEGEPQRVRTRSPASALSVRYEKARRGEFVVSAPVGFVKAGDRYESVAVVSGSRHDLHMGDKLAAPAAVERGGDGHLDAESVGLVSLALADAFGLGRVQRIDLPAALAPVLGVDLVGERERQGKAASRSASPRMHRPVSRMTRPRMVRIALSARFARLNCLAWA
jgi:hypothetical protein